MSKHEPGLKMRPETLALLKILAIGRRQIKKGRTVPADEVFYRLFARLDRNPPLASR